jgi:guanine deaminase
MSKIDDEKYMRLAIAKARAGIRDGQSPFGACVVKGDKVLACAHNQVRSHNDPTAHAEIQAIRAATKKIGKFDGLVGAVI